MGNYISVFWFRRDLRLHDNAGLYHALNGPYPVLPIFIFDSEILDGLEDKSDARVSFIHRSLEKLDNQLSDTGSGLLVRNGDPLEIWKKLVEQYSIAAVYTNRDYEPYAITRDQQIKKFLESKDIAFHSYKDQVIFEKDEVVKADGKPYTVFTPYMRKWKSLLNESDLKHDDTAYTNFLKHSSSAVPSLEEIGFTKSSTEIPSSNPGKIVIRNYHENRDFPARSGTTRLGIHLRFGTVSVREVVGMADLSNETFLNELIWREFYMQILFHFPHVIHRSFRSKYDRIEWLNDPRQFECWCRGQTGFPIVDAGMRELNATGYMHNRVRMIVASFLCKDLLIDWRWGEAYFASKLLDYELSSNNGGWQWAAGTGCDAAPYFRVFNPSAQASKFDPQNEYIKRWVPEFQSNEYPDPIVGHADARERALKTYKDAIS